MGFIEGVVHGGLSLADVFMQGKLMAGGLTGASTEDSQTTNRQAMYVSLAKTTEEFFSHRIDGNQAVAKGIGALADYKLTDYLLDHGQNPIVAKGAGLVAGWLAGHLTKGIADHLFKPTDTLDTAHQALVANGRIPANPNDIGQNPDLMQRLMAMVNPQSQGVSAPLPAGVMARAGTPGVS